MVFMPYISNGWEILTRKNAGTLYRKHFNATNENEYLVCLRDSSNINKRDECYFVAKSAKSADDKKDGFYIIYKRPIY